MASYYPGCKYSYTAHGNWGNRTGKVSRVTIHHSVGVWKTVDSIKACLADPNYGASWTYGIANDGGVIHCVPEDKRPWNSSNSANDGIAITFEVSNSAYGSNWPISSAAVNSLVDVLVYVCLKYSIPGLYFTNDIRTSNITIHRFFTYTTCPGQYFMDNLATIATRVNTILRASGVSLVPYQDPLGQSDYGSHFVSANAYAGNTPLVPGGRSPGTVPAGSCPYKVIEIALKEVGYIGKTSRENLDAKTSSNIVGKYTKYARDLHNANYYQADKNGYDWCTIFVDWVMWQVCGKDKAKADKMQYVSNVYGAGVGPSKNHYKSVGRLYSVGPKVGDEIFFGDYHTGIIYKVDDSGVWTIEGNTNNSRVAVCGPYKLKSDGSIKLSSGKPVTFGRPNYDSTYGQDGTGIPSDYFEDYTDDPAFQEAIYGYTRLPLELLDETKLHQYIVTANRDTKSIPFNKFRDKHISGVMLEAGWYFNASHSKHTDFKAGNFYTLTKAADKADVPYGLWMLGRARTKQEALLEMKELKNCVQVSNPNLGVWIKPVLTQYVSKNDEIVKVYQEELHKMGLKGKIGFYASNEELKLLTWEDHCKTWALWLVNHVKDLDLIDEMLTTEFWELDSSDVKEEVVVDKANLKPTFGVNFNIQGTFGVPLNLDKGTYTTKFYYGATSDDWMEYVMHIPENARENMPLLVFLHGDNHWGNPGSTYNLGPIVNAKTIYGDNFPFIALYPNMRVRSPQDEGYWYTGDNPAILKQLIDAVATAYTVNRSKIIISGHSRGAMGTWHLANKYTTYFSCAIPVSCGYGSVSYSNLAKLPIRAGAGTVGSDEQDYTRHMQYLCSNIRNEGGDAQFITLTGKSHGNADEAMFTEELFLWMFSQ